ncbi:hypothetical protein B9Q02_04420 [Candidatus Marsarchaeota G1 archaeon BE_D]|jgi:carboxymethylenebutenolidase|uniref:Dienelactone hydrolase domain-containing protein n=3 Tax=Candidatus Marsarchaeota TaxID=1978152 RepID=A0A2R6AHT6_9ARCH|nr:MAG: hypothetical protein B9Q02_04420 [Candidatus Marsarchaeota G1 archaeon BE_D]PSO02485.1 MAG: hypothetical protein B9Q10_01260 [Candidatus Marsarchaeota G2 archaeon ECH_B_SAG-E12]
MEISTQETQFKGSDGQALDAFLAYPKDQEKHPGVIVIHEIWGLNDQIRGVAKRIAGEGFVTVAPQLFTRYKHVLTERNIESAMRRIWSIPPSKRNDQETIKKAMEGMTENERKVVELLFSQRQKLQETMVKDLLACKDFLNSFERVKKDVLGVTGFCMGGGLAFQLATIWPFKATVVFYGSNPTPLESIANISGELMCLYAGEDEGINAGIPIAVEALLKHKKSFEIKVYKGAQHAFFNETRPSYNEEAAKDAWERLKSFFKRHLV